MTVDTTVNAVKCTGWTRDGNAFALMGAVGKCLRRAGRGDEVKVFMEEASSGDYDKVVQTCIKWTTDFGDETSSDEEVTEDIEVGSE